MAHNEVMMKVALEILNEQINNLKENYYCLIGSCANILEFSNYTVMDKRYRDARYFSECEKLNKKLKELNYELLSLRDKINNLL